MVTFATIYTLLIGLAPVMSLGCFIAAGLALRGDGGTNFEFGGSFARWALWGLLFLCLPGLPSFLSAMGISVLQAPGGGVSGGAAGMITTAVTTFVKTFLLGKLVPIAAGFLLLKAMLDSAEDKSPMNSIIAAIFVLSINGVWTLAQTWVGGGTGAYSFTTGLEAMMDYIANTLFIYASGFCVIGAIISYLRQRGFLHFIFAAVGMLTMSGIFNYASSWGLTAIPH